MLIVFILHKMLLPFSSWFLLFQAPRSHIHAKRLIDVYRVNWASQVVLVVKNLPANAGVIRDAGSISGLRRCPGGGHGNPIQSSCLENPMNRGAWWASVHRIVQSWTQLSAGGCTHALLYYDNDFHLKGWEIETQRVC